MANIDNEILMEITPEIEVMENVHSSIIKVMGVGGGGSNAVKHMYNMGITDVDFIICNTDRQALESNPIPIKIQLGERGLGAGAIPDVARQAAIDSEEQIRQALEGTEMLFITAGMGGGTGTGASPIIASIARDMGILTVAIVTFPFKFEQREKSEQAEEGIQKLSEDVDALIVIKNENLKSYYPDLKLSNAFAKVDDVLLIAAKSIAELITRKANINVDFNDVKTILKNSGTAMIGSGDAEGESRAANAVEMAINSPLLDQNSIYGAEKLLFFISDSTQSELTVTELEEITQGIENKTCTDSKKLIWGYGKDESLGDKVRVTVIATGLQNSKGYTPVKPNRDGQKEHPEPKSEPKHNDEGVINNVNINVQNNTNTIIIPLFPDNNELRDKSDREMDEYLRMPAIDRERELRTFSTNAKEEISIYKAGGSRGLEYTTAAFLKEVVD